MRIFSCLLPFLLFLVPLPCRGGTPPPQGGKASARPAKEEDLGELLARFRKEEKLPSPARAATASRIARSRDPHVVDFLLERIPKESRDERVQAALASGLGRWVGDGRVLSALPSLWPILSLPAKVSFTSGLKGPLPPRALSFFRTLLAQGDPRLLPVVANLVKPVARSLGKEEALAFLKQLARRELTARVRPYPALAAALARELARLGGRQAQAVFVALALADPPGQRGLFLSLAPRFQDRESLAWWVGKGLTSKNLHLRLLAIRGVEGSKDPAVLQALRRALSHKDPRIQREAARALGTSGDERGRKSLERLLRKGPMAARLEALDALHSLRKGDPAWVEVLLKLARSHYPAFRARALDLLADLGNRQVYPLVEKAASDRNWMVRSAFYAFAAKIREPRAVPLLIERLAKESGRLKQEVEKALRRIAGLTFAYDLARWREWWEKEKDRFRPPPLKKRIARKRRYGNSYYGIPVVSHRLIFIIDVSRSMAAKVGTGGRSRLDLAKEALVQAMTRFTKETRFNIIFFHTAVRAWEKKLTPATRKNQRKAEKFVRSMQPIGRTNIYGALKLAFQDKEVDTIYLLSDGAPTAGEVIDPNRIAREVAAWNLTRRIVIHTIALGPPSPLLRTLARRSGGQYVRRR